MVSGSYARHRTDERQRIGQAACLSTVSFARSRDAVSANSCVIEMTLATATSALESRFDHFLYAAVREDPHGPPLTVLSLLARLDIDPWTEAARLAQLPGEAAARALAGLISALPKGSATPPDSGNDRCSADHSPAAPVGARDRSANGLIWRTARDPDSEPRNNRRAGDPVPDRSPPTRLSSVPGRKEGVGGTCDGGTGSAGSAARRSAIRLVSE